jgi:hypothetical protein
MNPPVWNIYTTKIYKIKEYWINPCMVTDWPQYNNTKTQQWKKQQQNIQTIIEVSNTLLYDQWIIEEVM